FDNEQVESNLQVENRRAKSQTAVIQGVTSIRDLFDRTATMLSVIPRLTNLSSGPPPRQKTKD
ncbi:MAG TPA: hypothetical protein VMY39_03615, partial [Planctomycetota bacterium]|nr:hypothetical protein [Planctomycetota bacterium]